MQFGIFGVGDIATDPVSGRTPTEHERIKRMAETAIRAEEAGLDVFASGELSLGRHAEVLAALEPLVASHPFRERARLLQMLALFRSGRQASALEVFHSARRALDSLGLSPGAELRSLHQRILSSDPAVAVPVSRQLPPDVPDFVGRSVGLLVSALRGPGVPVIGLAELAGVGKTTLAVHVAHAVAGEFP